MRIICACILSIVFHKCCDSLIPPLGRIGAPNAPLGSFPKIGEEEEEEEEEEEQKRRRREEKRREGVTAKMALKENMPGKHSKKVD